MRPLGIRRGAATLAWQYGHTGQPGSQPGYSRGVGDSHACMADYATAIKNWRALAGYHERVARLREVVDRFEPRTLEITARVWRHPNQLSRRAGALPASPLPVSMGHS